MAGTGRPGAQARDDPDKPAMTSQIGDAMLLPGRAQASGRIGGWFFDQPYLLLSLTSLFWAGNTVLGRFIVGHVPPVTLAFIRWFGAFVIVLPFAAHHLKRDWPAIRSHVGLLTVLAL